MPILQGFEATMEHGEIPCKKAVFGLGNRRSIRLSYGTGGPADLRGCLGAK
jgi:hypothetical protein